VAIDSRTTLRDDTGINAPLTRVAIHTGDVLQVTSYRSLARPGTAVRNNSRYRAARNSLARRLRATSPSGSRISRLGAVRRIGP
jgi:hypothetical protein